MNYDVCDFNPLLKKELPLFHYDVALYCAQYCKEIRNVWPEYLTDFKERITSYASQVKVLRPKTSEISQDIRIYIFDHRLNLLFAALDETGKVASYFSKFCAQYKKYDIERHYYGDGDKIGSAYPCKAGESLSFEYNWNELRAFNKQYGFLPVETFASSVVLTFQGKELVESRETTTEKCVMLLEKFRTKNLVDWKSINSEVELFDAFF